MIKIDLLKSLEKQRSSRLISSITGDRVPFATNIAGDIVLLLSNLLDQIGKVKKISLFLYTSGGDMLAPIRIVKLIRNHGLKKPINFMDYTIAESDEYVSGYEPIMTPSMPYVSWPWPILNLPFNRDNQILERLTDLLYGHELLDMKLKEMASDAHSLESIWEITEKLPSLTDLLIEERNNE